MTLKNLDFHVHDDIELLKKVYPFALVQMAMNAHKRIGYPSGLNTKQVYIMQEDRIVYLGAAFLAIQFMKTNKGIRCENMPLVGL